MKKMQILKTRISWSKAFFSWMKNTHLRMNLEQYWGAAKLIYRNSPKTTDMKEMEETVKNSLDDVPVVQIQR